MKFLDLIKRLKSTQTKDTTLQASATLYPDKILIETIDRVKEGFGISSENISLLPIDIAAETLGSKVKHHLRLTQTGLSIPADYRQHYSNFLKKAGFKNGKEHHRNALRVEISQHDGLIKISPTKNGGYTGKDRGFVGVKDADIILNMAIDDAALGDKIKFGWTKCKCNCI